MSSRRVPLSNVLNVSHSPYRAVAAAAAAQKRSNTIDNNETVKQWQRHYRKVFPQFVFYFESIPDDLHRRCSRQVLSLGAREEKFFSKDVTHVITTRQIPPVAAASEAVGTAQNYNGQQKTINPLLLERTPTYSQINDAVPRGKFAFEAALGKKPTNNARPEMGLLPDGEFKKRPQGNVDVLTKAREMGMKIWALEKLQRMMTTMFDNNFESTTHGHNTRGNTATVGTLKPSHEADLTRMLRNERLNGATDRDPMVSSTDLVQFKGPFIFVHDLEERYRPTLAREYPKVNHREEGIWPMFRSVQDYKCPFVEDYGYTKREPPKQTKRKAAAAPDAPACQSREQGGVTKRPRIDDTIAKMPLGAAGNGANRGAPKPAAAKPEAKMFHPPRAMPAKRVSSELMGAPPQRMRVGHGQRPRKLGGEPIASGVQPSNITSAIKSQMVSSTAAAPGTKVGTSREVMELKRKVLEKNSGVETKELLSQNTVPDAERVRNQRINPNFRAAKRKANEKLGYVDEDFTLSEEEENARRVAAADRAKLAPKPPVKRDPKPGYCENCREKFDDFDEHTISRRHRKFAVSTKNWSELDDLLMQLVRPLKHY
ncbi:MAG: hypothetical protein M1825_001925 [Sarcosagium campestre]|nr:MAG: hypothetical protein M1825_001925 [Sarcosagium campestre]